MGENGTEVTENEKLTENQAKIRILLNLTR
jgi:hypothetical protein